jgi:hypothetical protein
MRRRFFIFIIALAACHATHVFSFNIEKTEKIEKTFRFKDPKGKNLLIVDNVFGSISVKGTDSPEIQMTAIKRIRARSEEKVEEANETIYLDIAEEDDLVELYVDGPFRDRGRRSRGWRGFDREGYEVRFDFELRVPKGTNVELKTVIDGEIFVSGMEGEYEVDNVNGGIKMEKMGGSGDVYAVNGDVSIDFQENPDKDSRFGSLNGEVKLYFQPKLSADFYLKTFNGEVYTDFEMTYMAPKAIKSSEKDGKHVYKAGHLCCVRAGSGGPEIKLDGFNGDMFILKK